MISGLEDHIRLVTCGSDDEGSDRANKNMDECNTYWIYVIRDFTPQRDESAFRG